MVLVICEFFLNKLELLILHKVQLAFHHSTPGYHADHAVFMTSDGFSSLQLESFEKCESLIGYTFKDKQLLSKSLTHASISRTRLDSNERLEFLGDAVLGLLVCQILYEIYPDQTEGELTRIKSIVVSRETCAKVAKNLDLQEHILVGNGFNPSEEIPSSIFAGVFESVIAAIYIDGGLTHAREFIVTHLMQEIDEAAIKANGNNYKSMLQHLAQKANGEMPKYLLLDEKGPDHSKSFKMAASIGELQYKPAWGATKKEAEQKAATNAFYEIEGKPGPFESED